MNILCLPFVSILALATLPAAALREANAPAAGASAAKPAAGKSAVRVPAPAVRRDGGTERRDLRPERPVVPQIVIPLGKRATVAADGKPAAPGQSNPAAAATANGIDDGAARCEAQADAPARAACRDALARSAGARRN